MKTTFIKRFSVAGVVGALLLANFLPLTTLKAHAAITDAEEGARGQSSSTFVKTESITEEVAYGTNLAAYIAGKKAEWENTETGQGITDSFKTAWSALFVADSNLNIYRYPVWVSTTLKGITTSEECGGSGDSALPIGDADYITDSTQIDSGCATFHYDVAYQEVNVAYAATYFTVKFDTGTVLPDDLKFVDQTVAAGAVIDVPRTADGRTLPDILNEYCGQEMRYCYNGYTVRGFFTDPEHTTAYEGQPITADTTIYVAWNDEYAGRERIKEVSFTMTPLAAGTVFTQSDPEDEDTQRPQLDITLPTDVKYHLWGNDEDLNYSYLYAEKVLDMDYSKLFTGTIEKGGKYYAEIWLHVNDYTEAVFDHNLKLFINGVETPYELVEGELSTTGIAILIELDVPADEPAEEETSTVAAPDSGAFTASSSATPAISGAASIIALLGLAYFFKQKSIRR